MKSCLVFLFLFFFAEQLTIFYFGDKILLQKEVEIICKLFLPQPKGSRHMFHFVTTRGRGGINVGL